MRARCSMARTVCVIMSHPIVISTNYVCISSPLKLASARNKVSANPYGRFFIHRFRYNTKTQQQYQSNNKRYLSITERCSQNIRTLIVKRQSSDILLVIVSMFCVCRHNGSVGLAQSILQCYTMLIRPLCTPINIEGGPPFARSYYCRCFYIVMKNWGPRPDTDAKIMLKILYIWVSRQL